MPSPSSSQGKPQHQGEWLHTPELYADQIPALVAAGTPPDTAFVGSGEYRTYIKENLLLDITDYLEADPLVGAEGYFIEPQEPTVAHKMALVWHRLMLGRAAHLL